MTQFKGAPRNNSERGWNFNELNLDAAQRDSRWLIHTKRAEALAFDGPPMNLAIFVVAGSHVLHDPVVADAATVTWASR